MTPDAFIQTIAPSAQASMAVTRIPASFVIAEAVLESGWGRSLLATFAHNLFGVKADPSWHGDTWAHVTKEYDKGVPVMKPALWRKYADWQACMIDHAAFLLHNPRYQPAFAHCEDGEAFARAVAQAGYATDPAYADKLIAEIHARNLKQYDTPSTGKA